MRSSTFRVLTAAACALVLLAVGLTACGDDDTTAAPSPPAAEPAPPPEPAPAPEPAPPPEPAPAP